MQGKKKINVKLSDLEIEFCLNCPHWRCISGGNRCAELRLYLLSKKYDQKRRVKSMTRKKINIVSNKRAINRIETYKKNVAKGKELHSEVIEEFERNISPYLTKKGTVRKNLSKKRQEEFNKLVTDFKKTTASSAAKAKQKRKRTVETAAKRGTYSKEESLTIFKAFQESAIRTLSNKKYLDSSQNVMIIRDYVHSGEISIDEYKKVAQYIIDLKRLQLPQEVTGLIDKDDDKMLAETLIENFDRIDWEAIEDDVKSGKYDGIKFVEE